MLCKKLFLASTVLLVLASLPFISSVGASSEMWSQTYGGAGEDVAQSLVQTSDGGYALAGWTTSFGAGKADFWLVKIDVDGNMKWNRTYGGENSDRAWSLVETSDGGYAIAGLTYSFGAGKSDCWLVKTDSYGNMEWNRTIGGSIRSLVETSDGGYALAGETLLVKTDAYGNMEWNRTYGRAGIEHAYALVETSDGGYALTGSSGSPYSAKVYLVKTDEYGNMEWNRTYSARGIDYPQSLIETSDGGYALAGYTGSLENFYYDFWLGKTDAYGNMEWNRTYGGKDHDMAYSLVMTSDGGYALAGETRSFGGIRDFWLIKTDEYGVIPEFPSWFILPLLLTSTLLAILFRRRLSKIANK